MHPGSETSGGGGAAPASAGDRLISLRCMFCGRQLGKQKCYSQQRIYPPGRDTFGIEFKCPKCGLTTRF